MAIFKDSNPEEEAVLEVAKSMAVSARTAPKSRGIDNLKSAIVTGEDLKKLHETMIKFSDRWSFFERDAENIMKSEAVFLLGVSTEPTGLDCGACGRDCQKFKETEKKEGYAYQGPVCVMDMLSFGIALGSAAKTASEFDVDNRIMFSAGVAARESGILDESVVVAIPLSSSGKNIFFDRS